MHTLTHLPFNTADNITHGGAVDGDEVQDDNDEPENLNTTQVCNKYAAER